MTKNKDTDDVKIYPASKAMQKKAPLTNKDLNYVLQEANAGIENMRDDYLDWAKNDIVRLESAYDILKANPDDLQKIKNVHWIAHDMKGQGGTFGYTLMTTVLDYLCTFLEARSTMSKQDLKVTQLHINAAKTIISERLIDSGGETGDQIILGLEKMIGTGE